MSTLLFLNAAVLELKDKDHKKLLKSLLFFMRDKVQVRMKLLAFVVKN